MTENKTSPTDTAINAFIQSVENPTRRADAQALLDIYTHVTGEQPVMWGASIVGYGSYKYTLANGKEASFMRSGFSPRKQNLTLYLGAGLSANPDFLAELGKFKTSKACLYINKLADVDLSLVRRLIEFDLDEMNRKYPK